MASKTAKQIPFIYLFKWPGLRRTFEYTQATSGGTYEFTVPYSTEGPVPGQTQFDTRPIAPYTASYGNTTTKVRVSEMDVLDGNTIVVN